MMGFRKNKIINKALSDYLKHNPKAKWKDDFRDEVSKDNLDEIYNDIYKDQQGVCAYCEITLKWPTDDFTNDFRIEHFHPENCGDDDQHNYSLDWFNLLGCCHGGTQQTSRSYGKDFVGKKQHSCDAPKGNKILDDKILNPLSDLPVGVTFFSFKEDGSVSVGEHCPENMKEKTQASIDELNLDCLRLRKFREAVIEELRDSIEAEILDINDESALTSIIRKLREDLLMAEEKAEFHSTIGWYLAD